MNNILNSLKNLTKDQLQFEPLGRWIRQFDFKECDYKEYLPEIKSTNDYCRNILTEAPLECVLLYWPALVESAIHFHSGFWGYVAVLEGVAHNVSYTLKDSKLVQGTTVECRKGGIISEPDGIIHKITNPQKNKKLVTAHFYYPAITSFEGMQIFDLASKRIGILSDKANSASWQVPSDHFKEIEENAFEFISHEEAHKNSSHYISPIIPKPGSEDIIAFLQAYYNEQALRYDNFDLMHPSRRKYTETVDRLISKDILEHYPQIEEKLAIACGTGRRAMEIKNVTALDYNLTGVDVSEKMCEIARDRGMKVLHSPWLEADLSEDQSFDVVTFLYAFGHLSTRSKRLKVLKKIYRSLSDGGALYFDVFNLDDKNEWGPKALKIYNQEGLSDSGYDAGDVFYKKMGGEAVAYLHYFTQEEVKSLLIEAGFSQYDITHIGYVKKSGEVLESHDEGALFITARK